MNQEDIRWQQRFNNFEKSILFLENSLLIPTPTITEKAGIIQFFEITFELAWKRMKDYLEAQGFNEVSFPRQAIKVSFEQGIIINGHEWLTALQDRNLTTHTYDELFATTVVEKIKTNYYPLLAELYVYFKNIK